MRCCSECGGELEAAYRFCPWCAAPLRLKLVEFFAGDHQARADCAVSLDDAEAARLAHFLVGTEPRARRPGLLERLYSSLAR